MNQRLVVVNSSPFIALEKIGYLHLLPTLWGTLHVPPAVQREVFEIRPMPPWVEQVSLQQPIASRIASVRLGPGEREVIALALELDAEEVILDDLPARRLASALKIPVIGTLGLLLRAKKRDLIPLVRPLVEALENHGFYASERIIHGILTAAGEEEPSFAS
ncbi:MAG: DUF3368 domain-containing protein [Chloroflexia bacterium]|nr:DUF3368 domain-containing protein [Chloroflexia bacterium]